MCSTTEWISAGSDAVTAIAAGVGVAFALRGLKTWREQMTGESEYNLARRLLVGFYRVRDAVAYVRGPLITPEESRQALNEQGVDPASLPAKELSEKSRQAVYQKRWTRVAEARSQLQVELLEAEAVWPNALTAAVAPLDRCIRELVYGVSVYLDRNDGGYQDLSREERQRVFRIMFGDGDEAVSKPLDEAVAEAERVLRPHLARK